ncbi:hypothetical protein SAMN04487819_11522 [Actinopolyspora alba]|uniref:Uncharacterized protein n=1 Tax=Actinopolyspora alba TaxID=673379 RepID=A0A1I2B1J0_9ACTN|nr:hypothetical protein [Actinopolyspora alba]SFE50034.1 hypothetical protein SAMN04487819_11522 [Actinopolyspora alba]
MSTTEVETMTARAVAFAPAPGRSRWSLAARCPFCGYTHLHSVHRWAGAPVVKAARCCPWRAYRVRVTTVDLTGGASDA